MIKRAFYLFLFIASLTGFYFLSTSSVFNPSMELSSFFENVLSDISLISDAAIKNKSEVKNDKVTLAELGLKENTSKFIQANYNFQEDVTGNAYKTLTLLAIKMNERYLSGDYKAATNNLSEMRTIVRDSGLATEEKIRLYKKIRTMEEILSDLTSANKKIAEAKKESKSDNVNGLGDVLQGLKTSIESKKSKIEEISSYKIYLMIVCYVLLICGLVGMLYEYSKVKRNNTKESKELVTAINSIMEGADPKVLIRLKRLEYYEEIKISLFEALKIFSNQFLFLKESLNSLNVPVSFKYGNDLFSNTSMSRLCAELGISPESIGEFFCFNDLCYVKAGTETIFSLLPVDYKEIASVILLDRPDKLSGSVLVLYEEKVMLEHDKQEMIRKKEIAETRLRTVMDISRQQKQEYMGKISTIDNLIYSARNTLDNGLLLSSSVKNLGKKVSLVHQHINESLSLSSRIGEAKKATMNVLENFPELSDLIYTFSVWLYKTIDETKLGLVSGLSSEELKQAEYRIERMKLLVDDIDVAVDRFLAMQGNFNIEEMHDLIEELTITYKTVFNNTDRVNSGLEDLGVVF